MELIARVWSVWPCGPDTSTPVLPGDLLCVLVIQEQNFPPLGEKLLRELVTGKWTLCGSGRGKSGRPINDI